LDLEEAPHNWIAAFILFTTLIYYTTIYIII